MKYLYPKFSSVELAGIRLGGPGLGNLLFIFSNAFVLSVNTGCKLIWPTWASLKFGPYIRRERDKRFYGDLFQCNEKYVYGIRKKILLHRKKIPVHTVFDIYNAPDESVLVYSDFKMKFGELICYRKEIKRELLEITKTKSKTSLKDDFRKSVNVHIRLGDFSTSSVQQLKAGVNNVSIPLSWYIYIIRTLKEILGNYIIFNIFSDGMDSQLSDVLKIEGTRRITYGNSIADIIALSQSPLLIASGSSFSMWARFLGGNSVITFCNQLKEKGICFHEGFEAECETIDEQLKIDIRNLYKET